MSGSTQGLSKRDRALAELVRVRGWADDHSIEKAVAEASRAEGSPELGSVLIASGIITPAQLQALEDAIDGKSTRPRGGSAASDPTVRPASRVPAPSSSSDKTITGGDASGVTVVPSGIKKPPDQIGPYRVLRELGRGGMGVVYRALDPELRREVALKVMIAGAQASDADVERFRREAAVVAKMGRHPNLVQIHDIGRDGERLYFTMDFIEGRSAKQRVEEEGAFPPREGARIGAEIAGALAFSHKAGVVHRDVKPHNILLDRDNKSFLGDFGLAKDLSNSVGLTESGSAFGTPAYMPPEQAGGHASHATPLSDVYSLGATLFEILTGRPPFVGESGMDIIRQVIDADPPSLRTLNDSIHRDLEVICLKALRKEPARRYASAAEMETDLRRFLNGEPILARPAGRMERLLLKLKRQRAVVAVAGAGLIAAAAIAGVATWRIKVKEDQDIRLKADLEKREKDATPLLLEGKSLVDRADEATKNGGWKERAEYSRRAVETLMKARAILPESEDVLYELGRGLWRAGREDEALRVLEEAVAKNPKDPRAWFEHGSICQQRLSRSRGTLMRLALEAASNEVGFVASGFSGNVIAWVGGTGASGDEARLRETAAADFRQVIALKAVTHLAAYGEAMLLFYEDKPEAALAKIDEALKSNQYFADAIHARAEIMETWKKDIRAAIVERKMLCEQQPQNPEFGLEYAMSLRAAGKGKEALDLARKAAERVDGNPPLVLRASQILLQCGDYKLSGSLAKKALESGGEGVNRAEAARCIVNALLAIGDNENGAKALDEYKDLMEPDWAAVYRGEIAMAKGDVPEGLRGFRAAKDGSSASRSTVPFTIYVEQGAGNLDRAEHMTKLAVEYGISDAYLMLRGLIRMERGDAKAALEDFEDVRKKFPSLNANLSNVAAAKFLLHDYAGSIDALELSVTSTPLSRQMKERAKKSFEDLRKELAVVKGPQDAAKVVEKIYVLLMLASSQTPDKATQAAIREGLRGVLRLLQQFYAEEGMWKESAGAAERYIGITKTGGMLFHLAEARAQAGDADGALKALQEAQAAGFDDGGRLSQDEAFATLKARPEFGDIHSRCR